jgi:hypothetical protein
MPVRPAGSSPPPVVRTTTSTPTASTSSPSTGVVGAITNALSSDSFQDGLGQVIANGLTGNSSSSGKPDWAEKPREPNGEGKFKNKSDVDIFRNMSMDDIASASPREIFAMSANQVAGLEKLINGGPAVYDKYAKGDGKDNKLSPAQETAMEKEMNEHYQENMSKLSPEQQRAFTFAKLHRGIFKDMLAMLQKHSKIAG